MVAFQKFYIVANGTRMWLVADITTKTILKMIQTKEEMFLAEMGINSQATIEGDYTATYKLKDLLKEYAGQCNIADVVALEDLKDFAYDNCRLHNSDRLSEIMERL